MANLKINKKKSFPNRTEIEEIFLNATSTNIDFRRKTKIVLYWKPAPAVVGYNLYRSDKKGPINGARPITQVNTCRELKAFVPEDTEAWSQLANAFTSVAARHEMHVVSDHLRRGRIEDVSGLFSQRSLLIGSNFERVKPILITTALNPCDVIQRGLTDEEQALFDILANTNLPLRQARGWAFIESNVTLGTTYTYELRGVMQNGNEVVLDRDVTIKAGVFRLPQPPSGFSLTAGDSRILALWNRNNYAFSYIIQRADNPGGSFSNINDAPIIYDIEKDLNNESLPAAKPGFVDFQRWDDEGLPVSHPVAGVDIDGPSNNDTYYYRVASCDILNRHGAWSSIQDAIPLNTTPPMVPKDVQINADASASGLRLSWRKVTRDVKNHQIQGITHYKIYRSDLLSSLEDMALLPACQITNVSADPTDPTTVTLTWLDNNPILRVTYGEKDFWYRIRCTDEQGNESSPSAALAGRLPDITPPGPTHVIGADCCVDHITVFWLPNSEPDLAGYLIYRGICDRGQPYRPQGRDQKETKEPCDFMLVGEVRLTEAETKLTQTGRIFFEDSSIPSGSPLCYAYWVRAFDFAGNLYPGNHGCPEEFGAFPEYACQRLYEETPPPVPIITALKARDGAVQIEWISSPIQDLRAFHVYRSDRENDLPVFVGCILSDGSPYPGRWEGMKPDCSEIPAEANLLAVQGSYLDRSVQPNNIYWYRVSALDWLGNESESADLTVIPAISTFTYDRSFLGSPAVLPPGVVEPDGRGLLVTWTPAFDPLKCKGIFVFRSRSNGGDYRQVSELVQADHFEDPSALRGKNYWYRVQAMALDGTLSRPSAPVCYRY